MVVESERRHRERQREREKETRQQEMLRESEDTGRGRENEGEWTREGETENRDRGMGRNGGRHRMLVGVHPGFAKAQKKKCAKKDRISRLEPRAGSVPPAFPTWLPRQIMEKKTIFFWFMKHAVSMHMAKTPVFRWGCGPPPTSSTPPV